MTKEVAGNVAMRRTSIAGVKRSRNAERGKELGEKPMTKVGSGGEELREGKCKVMWGCAGLGQELACHSGCERRPLEGFKRKGPI